METHGEKPVEKIIIGELDKSAFTDEQLEQMARKLEEGGLVPGSDIRAAAAQMAAESVVPPTMEAGTPKEEETPELLALAGEIVKTPEPVAKVEGGVRGAVAVAEDLLLISKKKSEVAEEQLAEARTRLKDDGSKVRGYLYPQNINLDNGEERIKLGDRKRRLGELAKAIQTGSVSSEQSDFLGELGYKVDKMGLVVNEDIGGETEESVVEAKDEKKTEINVDEIIKESEEIYAKCFLKQSPDTSKKDDFIDSERLLRKLGYNDTTLNNLTDQVEGGDMGAYVTIYEAAREKYLAAVVGQESFGKLKLTASQIESFKKRGSNEAKRTNALLDNIVTSAIHTADNRGWTEGQKDRLIDYLSERFSVSFSEETDKNKIPKSENELRDQLEQLKVLGNLDVEDRMIGRLIQDLTKEEAYGLAKIAAERKAEIQKEKMEQRKTDMLIGMEGVPKGDDETEWREWARSRMTRVLTNGGRVEGGATGIFSAVSEDPIYGGKRTVDGLIYMPADLQDEIKGKVNARTGATEIVGALENVQGLGELNKNWRDAHKSLKAIGEAFERGYSLPGSDLNKAFLNDLSSEDGIEKDGGSKYVAKALQIYWAMAHSDDSGSRETLGREARTILDAEGLRDTLFDPVTGKYKSLYNNNKLSPAEIDKIRSEIAGKCGGTFYDNIGFIYAGFFGISAYGSSSTAPGIANVDAMGLMIHTETNRFKTEDDRTSDTKRQYRFLPDLIANNLTEREWVSKGKDRQKVFGAPSSASVRVLELGPHTGNFQDMVGAKERSSFYLIRERGSHGKFRTVKKIGTVDAEGVPYARNIAEVDQWWKANKNRIDNEEIADEHLPVYEIDDSRWEKVPLETLIKEGRINELDMGESEVNIFGLMRFREKAAVNVWKLFSTLEEDLGKTKDVASRDTMLISRKATLTEPTPQYNRQTQHYMAYLWLHALIYKNSESWLKDGDKKNDLRLMIERAVVLGLISSVQFKALDSEYKIGAEGGFLKPFQYMAKDIQKGLGKQ